MSASDGDGAVGRPPRRGLGAAAMDLARRVRSAGSGGDIRTLPPEEDRERPLRMRRELIASTLVFAALWVPFGFGALLGRLPSDQPLEPRAAWVIALASSLALIGWVVQREASAQARFYPLAFAALPLAHLTLAGSAAVASLDSILFVFVALFVAIRAAGRVLLRNHGSQPSTRLSLVLLMVILLPLPLITAGWGLASTIVIADITRAMHPVPALRGEERLTEFTTTDGLTLRGTYWPGITGAPAIVLVHGRGDGRDRMTNWARALNERGAHVLAYDARAHAVSDGVLCTYADREPGDVVSAAQHLLSTSHADGSALAAIGESMGGGAVLAALPALRNLGMRRAVLFAPASDYQAIVDGSLPGAPILPLTHAMMFVVSRGLGTRSPTELRPIEALDDAPDVEVLVIHGRDDSTVPVELTERMASHLGVTTHLLDGVGHNGLGAHVLGDASLRAEVKQFIGLE